MNTTPDYLSMTATDLAWRIAVEHNLIHLSDDDLDHLLWEHTAFPCNDVPGWAAQLRQRFANGLPPCLAGGVCNAYDDIEAPS